MVPRNVTAPLLPFSVGDHPSVAVAVVVIIASTESHVSTTYPRFLTAAMPSFLAASDTVCYYPEFISKQNLPDN
jgi:hypothetical protein